LFANRIVYAKWNTNQFLLVAGT